MIPIEDFTGILSEMTDSLPAELKEELYGGVLVDSSLKLHPYSRNNDLYILGEYIRDNVGARIVLYYGSFEKSYGACPENELKREMRRVLLHEFRHHLEARAGWKDLEVEDEKALGKYLLRFRKNKDQ